MYYSNAKTGVLTAQSEHHTTDLAMRLRREIGAGLTIPLVNKSQLRRSGNFMIPFPVSSYSSHWSPNSEV